MKKEDENLIKKYGEKAKNNVVIIETKDYKIEEKREEILKERERQAQAKSNISNLSEEERNQRMKEREKKIEERKTIVEERRKELEERRNEKNSEYKISLSDLKNSLKTIKKTTTDKEIKEYITQFKSQNIDMKVSNIKRNKNGEITKIKISLIENSGDKNNKSEAKSESTIEYYNQTIPNIFVGKQNGKLVIQSK